MTRRHWLWTLLCAPFAAKSSHMIRLPDDYVEITLKGHIGTHEPRIVDKWPTPDDDGYVYFRKVGPPIGCREGRPNHVVDMYEAFDELDTDSLSVVGDHTVSLKGWRFRINDRPDA